MSTLTLQVIPDPLNLSHPSDVQTSSGNGFPSFVDTPYRLVKEESLRPEKTVARQSHSRKDLAPASAAEGRDLESVQRWAQRVAAQAPPLAGPQVSSLVAILGGAR